MVGGALDRFRRPEYTGENRCIPCTVTNGVLAVVGSAILGTASFFGGLGPTLAAILALLFLGLGAASIYLRGYLVPGTPRLTKRYFPEWLLARFDKVEDDSPQPPTEEIDVESALVEAGVLEPKPNGDLGLTAAFDAALTEQIRTERESETERDALANIVGVDPSGLDFETVGDGAFVAFSAERRIGSWESRAAFLADAAAGRLLPDRVDQWDDIAPQVRGQLLAGLRLFLETCPACDGPVRFGQEVVESCCRTHDVVAVTCEDCASRLFEVQASQEMVDESAEAT